MVLIKSWKVALGLMVFIVLLNSVDYIPAEQQQQQQSIK